MLTDLAAKRHGLDVIMRQHGAPITNTYDEGQLRATVVLKVRIESLTCKQLGRWS